MGARNPKEQRIMMRVADQLNTRLERLADSLGQNKSSMAALCMALGMNTLETLVYASEHVNILDVITKANTQAGERLDQDIDEIQTSGTVPESSSPPEPERLPVGAPFGRGRGELRTDDGYQGYMRGL